MLDFYVSGLGMQTKRVMTSRATIVAGSLAYMGVLAAWLFKGTGAALVEVLRQTNPIPDVRPPCFWLVRSNNDPEMARDRKRDVGSGCLCVRS
jgi:hypothetical protein